MPDETLQTDSLHCPDCGYNLFGIASDRCPECGLSIDRSILGESRLPWNHRQSIGRVRAFLRTVVLATFRPRKIAQEINRPVDYAGALKFRRICLAVAMLPILVAIPAMIWGSDLRMDWPQRVGLAVVCGFSTWLYLLCITGLPSLFFHPNTLSTLRQNRAVALSFYAAAPLTWMLLPAILFGVCVLMMMNGPNQWFFDAEPLLVVAFVLLGSQFIMQASSSFILLKHTTLCSATRRWAMDICLVIAWIVLFWIVAIGIPAIVIYLAVVVESLR